MACVACWKAELTVWEKVKLAFGERRMVFALQLMCAGDSAGIMTGRSHYERHRDLFVESGDEKEFARMMRHVTAE